MARVNFVDGSVKSSIKHNYFSCQISRSSGGGFWAFGVETTEQWRGKLRLGGCFHWETSTPGRLSAPPVFCICGSGNWHTRSRLPHNNTQHLRFFSSSSSASVSVRRRMSGGGGEIPLVVEEEAGLIPAVCLGYMRQLFIPYLVAESCFDKFFVNFDFDQECLKYTVSKGLGMGIIAGSLMVKVPQILKIFGARSAAGITILSVVMELFAITSNMSYSYVNGFPFSAWGEACFLAVQTAIVAMLVLWYNNGSAMLAISFLVAYGASVYALVSGLTPVETLWSMQALNIPIIVISKLIQAISNFRNKSTGQLSAITIFMLFFGSLARIFTSIQETGDQIIIYTYLAATSVNALIAFQILWYWNSPANKKSKPGKVAQGSQGASKSGGKAQGKGKAKGAKEATAAPAAQTTSPKKNPGRKAKKDK